MSVILFTWGVCFSACWDTHPTSRPPPRQTPPWKTPPCLCACWNTTLPTADTSREQTTPGSRLPQKETLQEEIRKTPPQSSAYCQKWATSGQYTSYWNAFLSHLLSLPNICFIEDGLANNLDIYSFLYYRTQWSCAKVIFLHLSVSHSVAASGKAAYRTAKELRCSYSWGTGMGTIENNGSMYHVPVLYQPLDALTCTFYWRYNMLRVSFIKEDCCKVYLYCLHA